MFIFKSNFLLQLAVCLLDCIMAEFSQMILHGREVCTLQTKLVYPRIQLLSFLCSEITFLFLNNE